jgi:hypothetical protein
MESTTPATAGVTGSGTGCETAFERTREKTCEEAREEARERAAPVLRRSVWVTSLAELPSPVEMPPELD